MFGRWLKPALALALAMMVSACEAWLVTDTPDPRLAARPPTATFTRTPTVEINPPTFTPTITLTPRVSVTPLVGATNTPTDPELTANAFSPGGANQPSIGYFVAFPEELEPDEGLLLFWTADNGVSAAIYRLNPDGSPGRTWEVPLEGELPVTPLLQGRRETYVLSVTNGVLTVEQRVTIFVECDVDWFFNPPPEEGCPDPEIRTSQAVSQTFERGRMIRVALTGEIYVLFDFSLDAIVGSPPEAEGTPQIEEDLVAWLVRSDTFIEGQALDDPSIEPPAGLRQPQRGFGQLWRNTGDIRGRLGWAVGDEVPFTMQIQAETLPGGDWLYFSDEVGAIVVLLPDGQGWQIIGFQ